MRGHQLLIQSILEQNRKQKVVPPVNSPHRSPGTLPDMDNPELAIVLFPRQNLISNGWISAIGEQVRGLPHFPPCSFWTDLLYNAGYQADIQPAGCIKSFDLAWYDILHKPCYVCAMRQNPK